MSVFVNIVLAEFSVQLFGGFFKTGFKFKTETYQAVSMASCLLNKSLKLKFRLIEFKRQRKMFLERKNMREKRIKGMYQQIQFLNMSSNRFFIRFTRIFRIEFQFFVKCYEIVRQVKLRFKISTYQIYLRKMLKRFYPSSRNNYPRQGRLSTFNS